MKYMPIDKCGACPNFFTRKTGFGDEEYLAGCLMKTDKWLPLAWEEYIEGDAPIPEWCPLEDV